MVINRSWHEQVALFEPLCFAQDGDTILLIEDAVLAMQSPITLASFLAKCQANQISVAALVDDCRLRGIESKYPQIDLVNYAGYVDLVLAHKKQIAW